MSAKKQNRNARQAVIVLGMHRTGTSAISGVLSKLGVRAPKSLMPPTQDNPRGYWESTAIMKFNDRVLESAGTQWSDWDKFNAEWASSPLRDEFVGELSSLLEDEYGNDPLILVKDPRMCRMFPFWAAVMSDLGITPKILIPLRHPSEVIKSLEVRDHLTENQSRLIWLRHMLDAEYSTRGLHRAFVRYSDVLRDWQLEFARVSDDLDIKWPRASGATTAEIDAYLAPELRHHVATETMPAEGLGIPSWVSTTYRAIGLLINDAGLAEAQQMLDVVRNEFDRTSVVYAPVVHEQRFRFEREVDALKGSITAISQEKDALDLAHSALKQENLANYRLYEESNKLLSERDRHVRERDDAFVAMVAKYEVAGANLAVKLDRIESDHQAELAAISNRLNAEITKLKETILLAEESVLERFNETAELTKLVLNLEDRIGVQEVSMREASESADRIISESTKKNRSLLKTIEEINSKNHALELELEEQRTLLSTYHADMEKIHSGKYWRILTRLRKIGSLQRQPLVDEKNVKSDADVLRSSSLFDQDWYLKRYSDVRSRGMNPVKHYLKYGAREGRDPSAAFDTAGYMARYPDVALVGMNPLVHYIKHGRKEGRSISKKSAEANAH